MTEEYDKQAGAAASENACGESADCVERIAASDADTAAGSADAEADGADETTGASPGTAQACDDLGLNSLEANLAKFGIKPPGVA